MKKVTKWISGDGNEFASEAECKKHEDVTRIYHDFLNNCTYYNLGETIVSVDAVEFYNWIKKWPMLKKEKK